MKKINILWLACFISCAFIQNVHSTAVMSVDFGSEWMKVGVVSPGVPMEIALNKESKRKTPAVVGLRDGERTFGEDAYTVGVRFPKNSYGYLLDLLGKSYDNPAVQRYIKIFPHYTIISDPIRGTPLFQHDEETSFSPEELIAQLLNKAREFAQTSTGQIVTDCVITVPSYFNQAERSAMLEAAQLADLRVLQLISDHTAVALNYGIFRRKEINETAQYVIFYDMGAQSTKVSVVEYKIVKTKEKGFVETNPQLQVLGVGYDRYLGGLELTLRLRNHLAKKFNEMKKTPNDVFENPRAMAKLLKEANRVKTVLSANADHYAQVEGLLDDKDFRIQVTREELEEMCQDLIARAPKPLEDALKNAGLTLDVISQVILVGASTRVPKIQEVLQKSINMDLSKNINADEAAALGAVYRAADLSIGFKVKKFIIKDAVLFPVQVLFERETDGQVRYIRRTLFGLMNPYPQKKVITFNKHTSDFGFNVNYAELDHLPADEISVIGSLNLTKVTLKGVSDAISKTEGPNVESKGIKAHFAMDDSGLLRLVNVELVAEKTLSPEEQEEEEESSFAKIGSTISKLFGGDPPKKEEKDSEPENSYEQSAETEHSDQSESTEKSSENTTTASKENVTETAEPKVLKPKIIILKEEIKISEDYLSMPVLTEEQFKASINKIETLNKHDREKAKRESALNNLEAFVIDAQSKLETEEYASCGTPEEIEKILKVCVEASEWLYEDGSDATAKQYDDKLAHLKKKTNSVYARHWEHNERPDALAAFQGLLNSSRQFLVSATNFTKENNPEKDIFTEVEISVLTKSIEGAEKWLNDMIEEQKKLKKYEDVKLTVKSITDKMGEVDREVKYLLNKMKIWRPKKPPAVKENVTEGSGTAEDIVSENAAEAPPTESSGNEESDDSVKIETPSDDEKSTIPEEEPVISSDEDEHNEL